MLVRRCPTRADDLDPEADDASQLVPATLRRRRHAGRVGGLDDDDDGLTVPYIVRVERGTINRGIYDIAVLFDPTRPLDGELAAAAVERQGRSTRYGASTGQPRLQFRTEQNWADDTRRCRAASWSSTTASPTRSTTPTAILVAETMMMMKEYIVDTYGEIKYTMGNGCSGGSIQQNTRRVDLPGPARRHPAELRLPGLDHHRLEVADCVLLVNAYVSRRSGRADDAA